MDDGHIIDDPLMVVGVKPDFTNLGLEKKPVNPAPQNEGKV